MLSRLADEVISRKWPKNENEIEIFNFIFECNHFLAAFFYLGWVSFDLLYLFKLFLIALYILYNYRKKQFRAIRHI